MENDIPLLVAYGKSDDAALSAKDYGASVVNEIISEKKLKEREKEFAFPKERAAETPNYTTSPALSPQIFKLYDDEAVATENYYEDEDDNKVRQKLSAIKELSSEYIRSESGDGAIFRPQEKGQSQKDFDLSQNETHDRNGEITPYYATVKNELDGIFEKYPRETALERAIGGSRFVKINYAEDKYYVVGVITENDKEKYICYGVPSPYRDTPPKELAGYCSFVPLSIFDLKGNGYFIMFQDALTGKCVLKG